MFSTVFIVHVRALFSALFSASVFISVVLGQSMNYGKFRFRQLDGMLSVGTCLYIT